MKERKKSPMIIVGIIGACVLVLIAAIVVINRIGGSPAETDPAGSTVNTTAGDTQQEQPTDTTAQNSDTQTDTTGSKAEDPTVQTEEQLPGETLGEQIATPPQDQSSNVDIPVQIHPETGESMGIAFPYEVPEYQLVLEKLAPYTGMYVEDGNNGAATNVAMLMVRNDGDFPVEYTRIQIRYETETLIFDITALPVGQRLVVQEKTGKTIPDSKQLESSAMIVQRADMEMSQSQVSVTDVGNNTLRIENLTDQTIKTVRVFYKYYMEEEDIFVGGIAFTVRINRLAPNAAMTIQPSHYNSTTSRVVMVLTYDKEV